MNDLKRAEVTLRMYKAASKKISIFLAGFILLAWAAFGPASPCSAGMHELSDGQMAAVYATGFSTFSLTGDTARVDFNNITLSTWTEIDSMKMGYYNKIRTTGLGQRLDKRLPGNVQHVISSPRGFSSRRNFRT